MASVTSEPRRRDRLPKAMSEGARHGKPAAALKLRLSDQRRPTSSYSRPGRSVPTREAGPDAGAT
jgi:hypothetical protein